MTSNPDLEDFPWVEVEEKVNESSNILPIRRFSVRNYNIDTYVEMS
ncbi:hypothetical protein KGM_202943 [Danaus plexippus plexippus]|uniref:Uncharacterized protein n=1 Tax=Danaus plexippus plexippus TaxID=278856 RepID=A0A212F7N7_DANPL|nr:hypothetical protein KGM_202943 [Danaus plexippus plexippus]